MKNIHKVSLCLAVLVLSAANSHAQTVLGSFQGSADATDAGWVNPGTGNPITTDPADSFVAAGVPGYPLSLQVTGTAGSFGSDSLELKFSAAQVAAFNSNSYITFTFSVPAWTNGGYSQIYNLVLNAPGYGYNNQSWALASEQGATNGDSAGGDPNFNLYSGSPLQTQVVTFNYSSVLAAIKAGGESYLQLTFQGNQGGGAPPYIYMNNVVVSTLPYGVDTAVLGSFQGSSDPTDVGWVDNADSDPITAATNSAIYSFPSAGVPGYPQSLQVTHSGFYTGLELQLNTNQVAEFFANSWLTFTFSAPAWTNGGYSQIFGVQVNAPGIGTTTLPWANALEQGSVGNNQSGQPNFYFYNGSPLVSQTVTINYSSILPSITGAPNPTFVQLQFQENNGGGAPNYYYINNVELSSGPFGVAAVAPAPKVGAQPAKPGLRIFAGSSGSIYDREELDTANSGDESWVGGGTASYSFTLEDFPVAPGLQCHLFLVPTATLPPGGTATGDEYLEYQASNNLWLQIVGGTANADGSSSYTADVAWKTADSNANPNNVALTYKSTGNQNPAGAWTLKFTSPSNGQLIPPGVAPLSFTISNSTVQTDFAAPVLACFGLQPNASGNEGTYIDYANISITGTPNPISDNFQNEPLGTTITGTAAGWDITDSAVQASLQLVNANTPLWVSWTSPAVGYGLGVSPILPITLPPGNQGPPYNVGSFVLPQQYNGYYDIPVTVNEAGTNWTLIPSDCLPSSADPTLTNAYFTLVKPPPAN